MSIDCNSKFENVLNIIDLLHKHVIFISNLGYKYKFDYIYVNLIKKLNLNIMELCNMLYSIKYNNKDEIYFIEYFTIIFDTIYNNIKKMKYYIYTCL